MNYRFPVQLLRKRALIVQGNSLCELGTGEQLRAGLFQRRHSILKEISMAIEPTENSPGTPSPPETAPPSREPEITEPLPNIPPPNSITPGDPDITPAPRPDEPLDS